MTAPPVPVSNMTGLTLFVCAALADSSPERQRALKDALLPLAPLVGRQSPAREGDQAVVDAVCDVVGRAWRPAAPWRARLVRVGRQDLASW